MCLLSDQFVVDVCKAIDKSPFVYVEQTDNKALNDFFVAESYPASTVKLDLTGAKATFVDNFDKPVITLKTGKGPWYSDMHGGFGGAKFLPMNADPKKGPFIFNSDKTMTIRMEKVDGKWQSGLIQTANNAGVGFCQKYGIFELRAKFPKGAGTWPGFWLKAMDENLDASIRRPEIDIVEAYGGNDYRGWHGAMHLWSAGKPKAGDTFSTWAMSVYNKLPIDMFDGMFHTYAAEVSPHWLRFFVDRKLVARMPMLPEFQKKLFILVNLAMHEGEVVPDTAVYDMVIDYVAAWQRPEWSAL